MWFGSINLGVFRSICRSRSTLVPNMIQILVVLQSYQCATCRCLHVLNNSEELSKAERPIEIFEVMVWLIELWVCWRMHDTCIILYMFANRGFEHMPVFVLISSYFHSFVCTRDCGHVRGFRIDPRLSAVHRAVMSGAPWSCVASPESRRIPWSKKTMIILGKNITTLQLERHYHWHDRWQEKAFQIPHTHWLFHSIL